MSEATEKNENEAVTDESAVATEEAPEVESGKKPISIEADLLTEEALKEIEEQNGKPVEPIPYEVKSSEDKPGSAIGLKIEVAADAWSKELNRYYEKLRKDVVLPGFRKGRAPVKLIRIRMGEEADLDAIQEVATNVLRQQAIKEKYEIVADPKVIDWTNEEGKALSFEASVEVEPTIELKEYKGLTVEVEDAKVPDEAVETELSRLRSDYATWETAPQDHKLAEGDAVSTDLVVTGDKGQELKHLGWENKFLTHYKGQLPEELTEKMTGAKSGDTIEATVTTSRNTRRGDTVDSTDTYKITLREIKVRTMPELDDEFAKDLGEHETLAELRDSIRKKLEEDADRRRKQYAIAEITKAIIEKNPFEVPASMIGSAQYQSIMQDSYQLQRMGLTLDQVVSDPTAYMSNHAAGATFRVKQSYIALKLAELEKLEVTDADVDKEIERMAEEAGRKPLAIRAKLEAEKALDNLKGNLLDKKIADFLIENNTVNYVEPKPAEEPESQEEKKSTKKSSKKKKEAEEASEES